jgi:hypothetical protein
VYSDCAIARALRYDRVTMADQITRQDLIDMEERLKAYMNERSEKVETNLLTAFLGWSRSMEIRVGRAS